MLAAGIIERPNARIAPDDVLVVEAAFEKAADDAAQIEDFLRRDVDRTGIAVDRHLGRADQREALLEGDDEDDAAIGILQQISLLALVEAGEDGTAALDHPRPVAPRETAAPFPPPPDPPPPRPCTAAGARD